MGRSKQMTNETKKTRKPAEKIEFRAVETFASVPGIEDKIKITLIEVELDGVKHQSSTKKACVAWIKERRKNEREQKALEKEAAKEQKALEKAGEMFPAVTDRLEYHVAKIKTLMTNETVTDEQQDQLKTAVEVIEIVISRRNEQGVSGKEEETE